MMSLGPTVLSPSRTTATNPKSFSSPARIRLKVWLNGSKLLDKQIENKKNI